MRGMSVVARGGKRRGEKSRPRVFVACSVCVCVWDGRLMLGAVRERGGCVWQRRKRKKTEGGKQIGEITGLTASFVWFGLWVFPFLVILFCSDANFLMGNAFGLTFPKLYGISRLLFFWPKHSHTHSFKVFSCYCWFFVGGPAFQPTGPYPRYLPPYLGVPALVEFLHHPLDVCVPAHRHVDQEGVGDDPRPMPEESRLCLVVLCVVLIAVADERDTCVHIRSARLVSVPWM